MGWRSRDLLIALAAAVVWAMPAGAADLTFPGRIEARNQAEVAPGVSGVVTAVLFEGGEAVEKGAPLFRIDPLIFAAAVSEAEATLAGAEADRLLAAQEARRAQALTERGVASDERLEAAEARLAGAEAAKAAAAAGLELARIDLDRATVRAPIAGILGRPLIALGTFVEAEAGPPLARITRLDEVIVAYGVPYDVRLQTLEETGAETIEALFEAITLSIVLPGGRLYGETAKPMAADPVVDPETGALTIYAVVANPKRLLRPGMRVEVLVTIDRAELEGQATEAGQ